jgi:protein-S-isoprenylcysteine O-methyltransferase Ste14
MTPEQEAEYALNFGVARSDLPEEAQRAYDRLAEQRRRPSVPASHAGSGAASNRGMPGRAAWLGTALVFLLGQGSGIVLLPYAFTGWQPGPPWPLAVRVLGVALITIGGIAVISGFIWFVTEGVGALQPLKMPNSWRLTFVGPYRYMRNPMYLAIVIAIIGQALLLSRLVLLAYAAVLLAVFVLLVRFYDEPSMARRFGAEFDAYRKQVPGWWPRRPRQTS